MSCATVELHRQCYQQLKATQRWILQHCRQADDSETCGWMAQWWYCRHDHVNKKVLAILWDRGGICVITRGEKGVLRQLNSNLIEPIWTNSLVQHRVSHKWSKLSPILIWFVSATTQNKNSRLFNWGLSSLKLVWSWTHQPLKQHYLVLQPKNPKLQNITLI